MLSYSLRPVAREAGTDNDLGFLIGVSKPTRYTGGEVNEVRKEEAPGLLHVALAFPDAYEIAMSTVGLKILYGILNAREDVWAERVFMPMPDMAEALEKRGLLLFSLESKRPLKAFDLVGFTLQFELTYTNILHMLRMGGVPVMASDRGPSDPIVVAGGPCAVNPEPLAPFMDAFFIGDGEEGVTDLCDVVRRTRGRPRSQVLRALANIEGVYVPALYRTEVDSSTGMETVTGPQEPNIPFPVRRRLVYELDKRPFPSSVIVPHHEIVHDRYTIEIARGCGVGCRFCQAGYTYRPARDRSPDAVRESVARGLQATGYDEVTLLSLNAGEYAGIEKLVQRISEDGAWQGAGVAMPSLRVRSLTKELAASLSAGRKSGFTLAPEAGTQRLRDVINKQVGEEDLARAAGVVFSSGWSLVKLYFMIGLPTETEEDVKGIARLSRLVVAKGREAGCKHPRVTVSTSSFVPKPFTPFQWCAMVPPDVLRDKQAQLKKELKSPATYRWHDVDMSVVEAAFSLGDRRLSKVLEEAAALGCRFDGWTEHFRWDLWRQAFERAGVFFEPYVFRERAREERLPWDVVDIGVTKGFLWKERERAFAGEVTEACGPGLCHACGFMAQACLSGELAREEQPEQEAPRTRARRKERPLRYRLRYRKVGPARFLGHLDLVDVLVRALRRCGVRLTYSQGYHPMPKVELPAPLPLGVEGLEEWLEFHAAPVDRAALLQMLSKNLPAGLVAEKLFLLPDSAPPLSELVLQHYEVGPESFGEAEAREFRRRAESFVASETWPVTRAGKEKAKTLDLRERVTETAWRGDALAVTLEKGGFMDLVETLCPGPLKERARLVRLGLSFAKEKDINHRDTEGTEEAERKSS